MPITPSLRHCSNKYKLAREGEKDKEKDEDIEKGKEFLIYIYIYIYTQKKKLLNELKKIRVNFSTKCNYIFPPKSNLFEMSCCNLVV